MKVKEFRGVKIGDKGYKIDYNYVTCSLGVFEGIVHEIVKFENFIYDSDHAIILRSAIPCDKGHKLYMDEEGFDYVMIDGKCYPLSFGCSLYSEKNPPNSTYVKDKKELEFIKAKLKKKAIEFATKDFD